MIIKTKRFAYDILKEYYDYCEKTETISYFNGCTTVLGARKVGKTILLKQLCEVEPSKSYYMDCTDMPEMFDFESFYEKCLSKGVSRVFLDEVCKVPDDIIADFIESTKLYSAKILITITGSVKLSVSKLSSRIGRGRTIELPPISYTEQIGWEGVSSSSELLLNFLRSGNITVEQNTKDSYWLNYINSVVEDTLNSYLRRTSIEKMNIPSTNKIFDALKYISLCQFIYRKDDGSFVDIPALPRKIKSSIPDFKKLKVKYELSKQDIVETCKVLFAAGLARRIDGATSSVLNALGVDNTAVLHRVDEDVPALLFEYPWFASYAISTEIEDYAGLLDFRLENELMLRMTYLYRVVDKYRDLDSNELDIVYTVGDCFDSGLYAVECKNRVSSNVQNSDIRHYLSLKTSLNLNELVISCSDKTEISSDYSFVRNDILLTALDKSYFKRCHDDFLGDSCGLYCNKSVLELIARQS